MPPYRTIPSNEEPDLSRGLLLSLEPTSQDINYYCFVMCSVVFNQLPDDKHYSEEI